MKKPTAETVMPPTAGQRGPAEHDRRAQIIEAADAYFRHYGYNKTTVADLAKAIGLSTAYIYKFFDSKQAVGEAICGKCLGIILDELTKIAHAKRPADERLAEMYISIARESERRFFHDRRLHDIINIARASQWQIAKDHQAAVLELILHVVAEGRAAGEFETDSSLFKTCNAVAETFLLVWHPVLLEERLDGLEERAAEISALVLRGLRKK
ncbi:TetR/AcrR family transcriptional regulator [Acidocella aminolytica]|jgi:AcrR family transcriptional regulator|uniref:Transcriptional regulator TetR n=1 Tax=Acidocella aminolytica 101 = DSM 11237 TaxID=1120923 RepID=A0A0D6PK20_9PROT|nr:TetR/AcrR family transcriptional regulator [Acidocella aminolytica]GAN81558.1 transcriptional regulator TetR [Acidocella aminolytica 101 = DSM 11237]GBQ35992.1 transcriptional regulator [Acidocella aminolytica 101 = DSM 11237]SHF48034.1 transcriptional regulator, TetR family [Acidocella aminolytica 101 = DSM 11237]